MPLHFGVSFHKKELDVICGPDIHETIDFHIVGL